MSSDVTSQQPIRETTQSASGRSLVAHIRYVCVAPVATCLPHAPQQCAGICVKGRRVPWARDLAQSRCRSRLQFFKLMGCCRHGHGPGPITLRPDTCSHGSRTNIDRPPALGRGGSSGAWRHRAEFGTKRLSDQLSDYGSSVTHRLQASMSRFRVHLLTFTVRQRASGRGSRAPATWDR
jgi:hypothetical protein